MKKFPDWKTIQPWDRFNHQGKMPYLWREQIMKRQLGGKTRNEGQTIISTSCAQRYPKQMTWRDTSLTQKPVNQTWNWFLVVLQFPGTAAPWNVQGNPITNINIPVARGVRKNFKILSYNKSSMSLFQYLPIATRLILVHLLSRDKLFLLQKTEIFWASKINQFLVQF